MAKVLKLIFEIPLSKNSQVGDMRKACELVPAFKASVEAAGLKVALVEENIVTRPGRD